MLRTFLLVVIVAWGLGACRQGGAIDDIRGPRGFTDYRGIFYSFAVYWTRIINTTNTPLTGGIS